MKVLVCDPIDQEAIDQMRREGIEVDVRPTITDKELEVTIPGYRAMVVRSRTRVTKKIIDAGKELKAIIRGGVGLDNIDVDYAQSKGITVMNTPDASSLSVAELTIGYLFALARHIPQATTSLKAHKWEKKRFKGEEIAGKILGLIGCGRIGSEVAKRAAALGMRVICYDVIPDDILETTWVAFEELLRTADYISLHLPLTDETRGLIGRSQFEKMKKGVRIVQCARGGIIDEDALYKAIRSGKVAGAALDVFAAEPARDNRLFELDEVIGSPHIGASTVESQSRVGAEVAAKVIDFYRENR